MDYDSILFLFWYSSCPRSASNSSFYLDSVSFDVSSEFFVYFLGFWHSKVYQIMLYFPTPTLLPAFS